MAIKAVIEETTPVDETVVDETAKQYQQLDLGVQSRQETSEELVQTSLEIQEIEGKIDGYKHLIAIEKDTLKMLEKKRDDILHDLKVGQQRINLSLTVDEVLEEENDDNLSLDDYEPEEDYDEPRGLHDLEGYDRNNEVPNEQ
jgi:hypothetical protein